MNKTHPIMSSEGINPPLFDLYKQHEKTSGELMG